MKKMFFALFLVVLMTLSLAACSSKEKSVFDLIKESPIAKIELPNGTHTYVDSEIASLRTLADMELMESSLEPTDNENDWLFRITFNPSEKIKNAKEIVVSLHETYVQIGSEFYLTKQGVEFSSILEWTNSKFEYFMK